VTRAASKMDVAQELDVNFQGSDSQFFDPTALKKIEEHIRRPYVRGHLSYDLMTGEPKEFTRISDYIQNENAVLKLWVNLDHELRPPKDRDYAIAVDPSMGTGRNNAAVAIGDLSTKEKVGEWASPNMDPAALATFVAALSRFFAKDGDETYTIWEDNGPGTIFRHRYLSLGARRFFCRNDDRPGVNGTNRGLAGWHSTRETKDALIAEYRRALCAGEYINRSEIALQECYQYTYGKDGSLKHARADIDQDPSGAGVNHADRVIADALLWKALSKRTVKEKPVEIRTENSFWGRRQEHLRNQHRRLRDVW